MLTLALTLYAVTASMSSIRIAWCLTRGLGWLLGRIWAVGRRLVERAGSAARWLYVTHLQPQRHP